MNGKKAKLMRKAGISRKKDKRNYQSMTHKNKGMFADVVSKIQEQGGKIVDANE